MVMVERLQLVSTGLFAILAALLASSYTAGALTSVRTPDNVELSREVWDIALEDVAMPFPLKTLGEWVLESAE